MRTIFFIVIIIIFECQNSHAQIGRLYTFDFLNLAQSARATATGGLPIAIMDDDISQGFANPSLINSEMHHRLSVNHNFHLADISHGFLAYGIDVPSKNLSFMFGLNYVNYGKFVRSDRIGNRIGEFSGNENAITIGVSRQMDQRLRLGLNIKYASSDYDSYSSSGLGADIGIHYYNQEKEVSWAMVIKNIGGQISKYDLKREEFPIDFQIGYAKRLAHVPFRFSITAHHLQQWNLRSSEQDPDPVLIDQEQSGERVLSKGIDNLFRHLTFGGEFLIGKNEVFQLRFGYNHLRNKELSESGFRSLSGFSLGFGFKINKLHFNYGLGRYHLAGSANHLSLLFDLNSIFDKL